MKKVFFAVGKDFQSQKDSIIHELELHGSHKNITHLVLKEPPTLLTTLPLKRNHLLHSKGTTAQQLFPETHWNTLSLSHASLINFISKFSSQYNRNPRIVK